MPALDGLRGVAIAAVIGDHYFGLLGGFYGVDLFFVLSGFLITTLLLEEHEREGAISLRGFYVRRVRRLMPAAAVFLLVVAVFESRGGVTHVLRVIGEGGLYAGNVFSALSEYPTLTPVAHFWSLAQEEQFYLLWPPLLILLVRRLGLRRRAFFRGLLAVAFALALYRVALILGGAGWRRIYFSPDTRADGMILGCAIAFVRVRMKDVVGLSALVVFAAAAVMGAATNGAWNAIGLLIVELVACALVLSALEPGPLARILSLRPLVWLGTISYSLYIWQQLPAFELHYHHGFIGLPIALALAMFSYYLVEAPFRRRRVSAVPAVDDAPGTVAPVVAISTASG